MLISLLQLSKEAEAAISSAEVKVNELIEKSGLTTAILKAIVDKGVATRFTKETSRFRYDGPETTGLPALSNHQKVAVAELHSAFAEHPVVLLHGVTASGKTEVYAHLIHHVLEQGRQVLYLVPEIALTTQLTLRLQKLFGSKIIIYHSKFTDSERVEIWQKILHSNEPLVVLGGALGCISALWPVGPGGGG